MAVHLDHVALLVRSCEAAAQAAASLGLVIGPRESWPSEGTTEIYVGGDAVTARLLLVEPTHTGPYRRAMERRGPGLHHVAVLVPDLEAYVASLAGSGWYLHPQSLETVRKHRTAWLARPGTRLLVEVHERPAPDGKAALIQSLELPAAAVASPMLAALGCSSLATSPDDEATLVFAKRRLPLRQFAG